MLVLLFLVQQEELEWEEYSSMAFINIIEYVTIASTGDSTDFGDLSGVRGNAGGVSSATRGVCGGGRTPTVVNIIEYITMASTGDATDFGDLSVARNYLAGCSNGLRGTFGGGVPPSGHSNIIDFITIASTGNASDFGDLTVARSYAQGLGNGHGGINQEVIQRPQVIYNSGSGSALCGGGYTPGESLVIAEIHIPTLGNAADWGDLTSTGGHAYHGGASRTRGIKAGGYDAPGGNTDLIESIELASRGNASDFGNLIAVRTQPATTSDSTRSLTMGGTETTDIVFVTIATAGNATDFGNLTRSEANGNGPVSNGIRACSGGGNDGGTLTNIIDFVVIQSAGDSTDFGDLTVTRSQLGSFDSATRGVFVGGASPGSVDTIDYITMASAGDATDFGNLSTGTRHCSGNSSPTRGLRMGGQVSSTKSNIIEYVTIASTGNTTDFGDMLSAGYAYSTFSDSHGGLSLSE